LKPWNEEDHPCQEATYAVAKRKPVANQDLKENALEMTMTTLVFQPSELKFNIFTLYWWLFIFT